MFRREQFLPKLFCLIALPIFYPAVICAQQSGSGTSATPSLLPNIYTAQTAGVQVSDITMSGTATLPSTQGSPSGAITLKAIANGQSLVQLQLPGGMQTDFRVVLPLSRQGTWTDSTGASHSVPVQNLAGPHPAWFFPALIISSGLRSPNYWASDLGQMTRNGATVEHIAIWQVPIATAPSSAATSIQQQTQYDLYLDPTSLLPVAMTFNVYPDPSDPSQFLVPPVSSGEALLEEVDFSNYQSVQGVSVAQHIQIYFQNSLYCDIQIGGVSINAGLGTLAN